MVSTVARSGAARRNPGITTTGWVVLGVGVALVGGTIYFMTKPTAATPAPGATPALTPAQQQAAAAQIVAAQKAIQAAAVAANTPLGV